MASEKGFFKDSFLTIYSASSQTNLLLVTELNTKAVMIATDIRVKPNLNREWILEANYPQISSFYLFHLRFHEVLVFEVSN